MCVMKCASYLHVSSLNPPPNKQFDPPRSSLALDWMFQNYLSHMWMVLQYSIQFLFKFSLLCCLAVVS